MASLAAPVVAPADRPIVRATAPQRYKVQMTIGEETHENLRRLQALLRREIPSGDPAILFDRALSLLLEKVEKKKLGAVKTAQRKGAIRPGTDRRKSEMTVHAGPSGTPQSRHLPLPVSRAVWERDDGRCAFVAPSGRRCSERSFLELHHIEAYAKGGPPTVDNLALMCRSHNDYETERFYGRENGRVS